ncbi:zinc finger MYM-type protein 1-like [Heracleum sosnowskyi]|uniref:Zinc finger MYM-type protein 1-like n=1 Tax=Heracleum sosnowskyi TaxID=360622 RepID=A0AAD8IRP0_9APIA|nr:zinc finger MYM-type protein 1-like [Heracleum sosnowskyi]
MLANVVNIVSGSSKRLSELQIAHGIEVDHSVASRERETGRGLNQIGNLQRAGSTRWSSHFNSVCSLIDKYGSIIIVLENINNCSTNSSAQRGEARGTIKALKSFKFLFVLYLMHKIMGITDLLCRALQSKSIDILNAMDLVATTKELLQSLRDDGFDVLLHYVISVCEKNGITVPDMSARYMDEFRSVRQSDDISVEHHYHYDVFNSAIDFQLEELQYRFNDHVVELLRLSSSLEPKNNFGLFDKEHICTLATTFYPADFSQQDMYHLQLQLDHYKIDVVKHAKFQSLSTLSELCVQLVDTGKAEHYNLIYRLICLVLTLPVSTATTKRGFSAMKLLKTELRNKMGDEYLRDSILINVEREFAEDIDIDEVIDEFYAQKNRRVQLK